MLILLPPSEGKHCPSRGKPLDLNALSSPALTPLRSRVLASLQDLCREDSAGAIETLGLGPTQFDLVAQNAQLESAPTAPASSIYTGVLYAGLDYPTLAGPQRRRANTRLAFVSALFGLVRPNDRICAYRLSGGTRLPDVGALPAFWRTGVSAEAAVHRGLVVDMLSSPYSSMVALPKRAVTVKVWQQGPGGQRTAVSHFNKQTKGLLARDLVCADAKPGTADELLDLVRAAGWDAELDGRRLDVMMR